MVNNNCNLDISFQAQRDNQFQKNLNKTETDSYSKQRLENINKQNYLSSCCTYGDEEEHSKSSYRHNSSGTDERSACLQAANYERYNNFDDNNNYIKMSVNNVNREIASTKMFACNSTSRDERNNNNNPSGGFHYRGSNDKFILADSGSSQNFNSDDVTDYHHTIANHADGFYFYYGGLERRKVPSSRLQKGIKTPTDTMNKLNTTTIIDSTSPMRSKSTTPTLETNNENRLGLLLTISFISCLMLILAPVTDAVDCFKCSSRNGSNPACEDPFHNTNSTRVTTNMLPNPPPNVAYHTPCYAGKKSREGLFLASACIKLTGTFDTTGETMVVRHCALDSGTLTPDTELARMSHCGRFQFEGDYLRGCVLACPEDACNSAWSIQGVRNLKIATNVSDIIQAIWNTIITCLVPIITTKYLLF